MSLTTDTSLAMPPNNLSEVTGTLLLIVICHRRSLPPLIHWTRCFQQCFARDFRLQHSLNVQVRSWDELPENARKYVERVEELVGTTCEYIGVGPGRDAIVMRTSAHGSKNGAKSLQPV